MYFPPSLPLSLNAAKGGGFGLFISGDARDNPLLGAGNIFARNVMGDVIHDT